MTTDITELRGLIAAAQDSWRAEDRLTIALRIAAPALLDELERLRRFRTWVMDAVDAQGIQDLGKILRTEEEADSAQWEEREDRRDRLEETSIALVEAERGNPQFDGAWERYREARRAWRDAVDACRAARRTKENG